MTPTHAELVALLEEAADELGDFMDESDIAGRLSAAAEALKVGPSREALMELWLALDAEPDWPMTVRTIEAMDRCTRESEPRAEAPEEEALPQSLAGIDPDITGGKDVVEYLHERWAGDPTPRACCEEARAEERKRCAEMFREYIAESVRRASTVDEDAESDTDFAARMESGR